MEKKLVRILGMAVLVACGGTAWANTIVYDNFGEGDSYNIHVGHTIADGAPLNIDYDQGDAFIPSASGAMSDLWLAAARVAGANVLNVSLYDNADDAPGNVLWTYAFVGAMGPFETYAAPLHWTGTGPYLTAGTKYWLVASADENAWCTWLMNSVGDLGEHIYRENLGAWTNIAGNQGTHGAFRIAVPESATLTLIGLATLLLRRR